METYNELLKQFHESNAPTDFLPHYKSLLDDLQLARTRKKHDLLLKMTEVSHLQQNDDTRELTLSSACLSVMQESRVTSSKLDGESVGQLQLKREEEELKRQLAVLKAKTNEITSELALYRNRETTVRETNLGSSFTVLRQWKQLQQQAAVIEREEFRQQQILHDLKNRKGQLSDEIQKLIKDKQANDQLLKRWRRSKLARPTTPKEVKVKPDLQHILQALHFLAGLADQYYNNTGISGDEVKARYDWEQFKGGRGQMLRFYLQKGPFFDQIAAKRLVQFYCKLELELDRNQRAHRQATQTLNTLQISHEHLNANLRSIHEGKERSTIHALRKYGQDIQTLEEKLKNTCGRIARLATSLYQLLRRVIGFFKGIERVMGQSQAGRKLLRQLPDSSVIARFEQLLFRNPEEQTLQWTTHNLLQHIQANSLLRLYAESSTLSSALDMLDNYEKVASVAFKRAQDFPGEMFALLTQYLRIARTGKPLTRKQKMPDQSYCVQSKEYYRRDNFKLLEKLENEQLKRKGLLMRLPINLVPDSEIIQGVSAKPFASARSLTPRPSTLSSAVFKFTDIATKRQQHSMRKQKIRKLFGRLDSLSRSTKRLPLNPTLSYSRINTGLNSSSLSTLRETLRAQRSTVGALSKSNLRTQGFK